MKLSVGVHDIFHAVHPMSDYLMACEDDTPIEPLVVSYWYVVTEVDVQTNLVSLDCYYITSEYYIFCHHRGLIVDINFLNSRISQGLMFKR